MTPDELSGAIVRKAQRKHAPVPTADNPAEGGRFLDGNAFSIASFACFLLGILLTLVGFPRSAWPIWWLGIGLAFVSLILAKKKGLAVVVLLLNSIIMPFPYWVYFPG